MAKDRPEAGSGLRAPYVLNLAGPLRSQVVEGSCMNSRVGESSFVPCSSVYSGLAARRSRVFGGARRWASGHFHLFPALSTHRRWDPAGAQSLEPPSKPGGPVRSCFLPHLQVALSWGASRCRGQGWCTGDPFSIPSPLWGLEVPLEATGNLFSCPEEVQSMRGC